MSQDSEQLFLGTIERDLQVLPLIQIKLERAVRLTPTPESRAASDEALPLGNLFRIYAGASLSAACGHLDLWRMYFREDRILPQVGHYALIRAALESAATARWLLRPGDQAARFEDVAAYALEDARQRRTFEAEFPGMSQFVPPPDSEFRTGAERYAELLKERDDALIVEKKVGNPTDRVQGFAVLQPRSAWPYRILSAVSHGLPWQVFAMHTEEQVDVGLRDGKMARTSAAASISAATTRVAIDTVTRGIVDFERYVGDQPEA